MFPVWLNGAAQQQVLSACRLTGLCAVKMLWLPFVVLAAVGASALGRPGLGSSTAAEPCAAPLQWEGRWVVYDHGTGRNARAAVSYDGLNRRLRVLQQHKKHTPCQK